MSKVILGQVLAVETDGLDKLIFTYEAEGKNMKEATTFVLLNKGKAVILNIIEHAGGQRQTRKEERLDNNKILPIDVDQLGINSIVKVAVEINTGVGDEVRVFEVEEDESKS